MSQLSSHVGKLCRRLISRSTLLHFAVPLALVLVVVSCSDNARNPVAPSPVPGDAVPSFGAVVSSNGVGACLLDDVIGAAYVNSGDVNCTSKDIDIAIAKVSEYSFTSAAGPFTTLLPDSTIACTPGQTIYVRTSAILLNNAHERYDVGVWINPVANSSALTGTNCTHFNLLTSDDELGVSNLDSDQCGDISSDQDTVTVPLDVLTLTCSDTDNNGFVEVGACAAWQNSVGELDTTDPDSRVCPVSSPPRAGTTTTANGFRWGTTPETPAKCRCEPLQLPIEIQSILRIQKVTVPAGDATPFTFTPTNWNGGSTFTRAGNQGSFASAPLPNGT